MTSPALSAEDYASIERATAALRGSGWQISPSVNSAIDQWAGFVRAVETGYDECVYEYTNDMSIRKWFHEARPYMTLAAAEVIDSRLAPLDERFRAATLEAQQPPVGQARHWWERRLPRVLVGELADDVEALGLMSGDA